VKKCGSDKPKDQKKVGTKDKNCGTKDTHINFGEYLDDIEWAEADEHCGKADLVIVAGTSMSLRHITHLPFLAHKNGGKVVIINLQETPDDDKCDLRIFSKTDEVFEGLLERLGIEMDPIPVWRPRDSKPLKKLPKNLHSYYVKAAERLEVCAQMREAEAKERKKLQKNKAKIIEEEEEESDMLENLEKMQLKQSEKPVKDKKKKNKKLKEKENPVTLLIGNTHEEIQSMSSSKNMVESNNHHKWVVYVRSLEQVDLAEYVEKVEFRLHPTFFPPVVTVEESPFEVSRIGWGTFEIGIVVYWKAGGKKEYTHKLRFDQPKTETALTSLTKESTLDLKQ